MTTPTIHILSRNFIEQVKEICRDSGHTCPFWINQKTYYEIFEKDPLDSNLDALNYWKKCHEIAVNFHFSNEGKLGQIEIRCRPYEKINSCDYRNIQVEAKIMKVIAPHLNTGE